MDFLVEEGKIKLIIFGLSWCGRQGIPWNEIFAWEVMQGEKQQNLGVVDNKFCKAHKLMKICETLINFAKWKQKRKRTLNVHSCEERIRFCGMRSQKEK